MRKRMIKILFCLPLVSLLFSFGVPVSARAYETPLGKDVGSDTVYMSDIMTVSNYEGIAAEVRSVVDAVRAKMAQLYDLDKELIEGYITEVEAKLEMLSSAQTDQAEYNTLKADIEGLCKNILTASAESKVVSARATWHRPCESSYAAIKENVKMFRNVGINLIFVETFYHGCSAFKSEATDIPYHPSLAASYTDTEKGIVYNDYLSAFVACCKEYGIEVHAWVENFYVGINGNADILVKHPDWLVYNDDGSCAQRKEGGPYLFIDPANSEVQDLLISYYGELFEKHPDVAGLNLDYIRYPVSDRSTDTGYTVAAMKGFYDTLGLEFSDAQLADRTKMANKFKQLFDKNYLVGGQAEADSNYQKWVEYRTDIITDYVLRIKNEVKAPNDILLSTAVFAPLSDSLSQKKADWQSWYVNGWIDIATPMAYYSSASTVQSRVKEMIGIGGNNCLYYTGIASSYSGLPAWQNKEFIEASYNAGADGYVIFSSAQIVGHSDVQLALSSGVNNKWAVLPHAKIDIILTASFEDILDKADRLYIPAGGMTAEDRTALETVFNEIVENLDGTARGIYRAYGSVSALQKTGIGDYANGYSRERIAEQLGELASILDARISMQLISDGEWDPESGASRPSLEELETPDTPDVPVTPETPVDPETPESPETPDDPEDPDDPDIPETPDTGDDEPEEELNFFQRIWRAIVNFFRSLFQKE